jgi:hypothetical protein
MLCVNVYVLSKTEDILGNLAFNIFGDEVDSVRVAKGVNE